MRFCGTKLSNAAATSALTSGQVGILPHLKRTGAYRTNVGVTNLGIAQVDVSVKLFGPGGAQAGSERRLNVPAGALVQDNDVFGLAGAGDQEIAWATVEVLTAGGKVTAFASVIDNATQDPTIVSLVGP